MPHSAKTAGDVIPAGMQRPDYGGGGIVNLMSSIGAGRGAAAVAYPSLQLLDEIPLSRYRTVLLVLIDGLGYEYLRRDWPDSTIATHLRGPMTSVFPTTTAAAITTILTGLAPAQHAITGWHVWFQEIRTLAAVLPFRSRGGHESLQARGFDPATVLDARPIYPRLDVDSHVISPKRIAHSPFNTAFSAGAKIHGYDGLDQFFKNITDVVHADSAEKYIYAYWSDLDHVAHQYGVGSDETRNHFREIDTGFAQLLSDLDNSDTLVLLTADHGFIDTTPATRINLEDHVPLTAMLDIPLCGEPRAAYCYVHAGEERAFEAYVGAELADSACAIPSKQLMEMGLFGPGKPHPKLKERIGGQTLLMQDNFIIQDKLPGEKRSALIGVHGGLTTEELYVPLVLVET
ncbi:MAG: alkaline phosphatase family protein [Gammaproteobacteria bacterium]|nr:alkaline phosphatase family protein [Gammaproteobacteria bacterium]MDH3767643.1 alkaline phosphatase family protein [Gammaproteobacteria bacterium]